MDSLEWRREVINISDYLNSKPLELDFVRVAVSALTNQHMESTVDFLSLYELIKNNVTNCTPHTLYLILQSINYPQSDLERINNHATEIQYNLSSNEQFDLTLTMINTVIRMNNECYERYQFLLSRLIQGNPRITSRADFLERLRLNDAFKKENASTFRAALANARCKVFHEPLSDFCNKHSINVEAWDEEMPTFQEPPSKCTLKCTLVAVIFGVLILILLILFGTSVGLFSFFYFDAPSSENTPKEIPIYSNVPQYACYDTFFIRKVEVSSLRFQGAFSIDFFVISESDITYVSRLLEKVFQDTTDSYFTGHRIPLKYNSVDLICNPSGNLTYSLQLSVSDSDAPCPAQIYLFDSYDKFSEFQSEEHLGYPPTKNYVNTSGCYKANGNYNIEFPLQANKYYYAGLYARGITFTLFASGELFTINTTDLSSRCTIRNTASTCTVSLTGSSSLPSGHSNVCVLISSTSSGSVTLSPILATWNVYNVSGVAGFPVFLLIACVLMVVLLILCIRHCCCSSNSYIPLNRLV